MALYETSAQEKRRYNFTPTRMVILLIVWIILLVLAFLLGLRGGRRHVTMSGQRAPAMLQEMSVQAPDFGVQQDR